MFDAPVVSKHPAGETLAAGKGLDIARTLPIGAADSTVTSTLWGPFDTRGGCTAYFAESRKCALSEVLASFGRNIGTIDPLLKDAEFLGLTDSQLIDLVNAEWMERNHMIPGI